MTRPSFNAGELADALSSVATIITPSLKIPILQTCLIEAGSCSATRNLTELLDDIRY